VPTTATGYIFEPKTLFYTHGPVYNNRRRLFLCSEPTADPFELRDDGCPISITADEEFVARHARLLRTSLNSLSSIVLEMQTVETASNV
jgi:hypothetical protein